MRLSGINSFNKYAYDERNNKNSQSATNIPLTFDAKNEVKSPAFTGIDIINKMRPPLRKLKNFSTFEYSSLSNSELEFLRKEFDKNIPEKRKPFVHNLEVIHDRVSETLMNDYDKMYGKGNYVVIPIGRSVSSICKVLSYKIGENNVRPLPMSETRHFIKKSELEKVKYTPEFKIFKNYLASLGLSDEYLTFKKKKYILLDYCITGDSLSGIQNLMECIIGQRNQEKLVFDNVMNHITDEPTKTQTWKYLKNEDFKYLSFVTKAPNLKNPYTSFTDPKKVTKATKLTWFKLLDNEMTNKNYREKELIQN